MSTKSTIASGPNFHLYLETFDNQYVYLELQSADFEASRERVQIAIPAEVWEFIRKFSCFDFTLAECSDEELQTLVEREVDERIRNYQAPLEMSPAFFGSLVYGHASLPRERQIESGMEYFSSRRNEQRRIKKAINKLERSISLRSPSAPYEEPPVPSDTDSCASTSVDHHTYRITWSKEDGEYLGLCDEFPSLSWLDRTPEDALKGIRGVVNEVTRDSA